MGKIDKSKIIDFYQKNIYGMWRTGEKVSYEVLNVVSNRELVAENIASAKSKPVNPFFHFDEPETAAEKRVVRIYVEANGIKVSFDVTAYIPFEDTRAQFGGRSPFIVCMHPIKPRDYALEKGYAVIELDTLKIASDDCKHSGVFYDLYPYGTKGEEQTGVLMAWAWECSKVLDAIYAGLDEELMLDKSGAAVTGVSRWGKATAVCGAFDERFTFVIPTCSGAGGLALNNVISEGKTYNFESVGGPSEYTYGQNEPLGCLQSDAERGWFNDAFLNYKTMDEIPYEQYMLAALAADKNRFYMIVASYMGEDWVNAPAMWECFVRADELYDEMGLGRNLVAHFHKEGHAVIREDMEMMVDYFNYMKYGIGHEPDFATLKTSAFEKQ